MENIYYVEDDRNIASLVAEYLEQRDCIVSIIPSIAEARQMLSRQKPDLCLIDWNMPDGLGRCTLPFYPFPMEGHADYFLTARGDVKDIVAGFGCGADDYVVKPFELEVLYSRIQALCFGARRNCIRPGSQL